MHYFYPIRNYTLIQSNYISFLALNFQFLIISSITNQQFHFITGRFFSCHVFLLFLLIYRFKNFMCSFILLVFYFQLLNLGINLFPISFLNSSFIIDRNRLYVTFFYSIIFQSFWILKVLKDFNRDFIFSFICSLYTNYSE